MSLMTLIDFIGSSVLFIILLWIWYVHFRARSRRIWNCVRYFGGGRLQSPHPMTLEEVTKWLARDNNAEIGHVDEDHGFIFYRPRG
jgi:hypothetical protein